MLEGTSTRYVLFYSAFGSVMLCFSDFLDERAIVARAKLGQHALAMEGMLAIILGTLGCNDYDSALSIITTLSGDQATLSKLKSALEEEKKLTAQLKDNVTKLEDNKARMLKRNAELQSSFKSTEFDLNKQINNLKGELAEEKKQIEE